MKRLLRRPDLDVNKHIREGTTLTALFIAIERKQTEIVASLLEHSADPNVFHLDQSALHRACDLGFSVERSIIIDYLLVSGAIVYPHPQQYRMSSPRNIQELRMTNAVFPAAAFEKQSAYFISYLFFIFAIFAIFSASL